MYYHCTIPLLFRPFLRASFAPSFISPSEICTQAAANVTTLMRSYRQLHPVRRTSTFTPYIMLNNVIVALVDTSVTGTTHLPSIFKESLNNLTDMSVCHRFAEHTIQILQAFAHQRSTSFRRSSSCVESLPSKATASGEPPIWCLTVFSPSKELFGFSTDGFTVSITSRDPMSQNRLFSPFPYQGLPLLPAIDLINI